MFGRWQGKCGSLSSLLRTSVLRPSISFRLSWMFGASLWPFAGGHVSLTQRPMHSPMGTFPPSRRPTESQSPCPRPHFTCCRPSWPTERPFSRLRPIIANARHLLAPRIANRPVSRASSIRIPGTRLTFHWGSLWAAGSDPLFGANGTSPADFTTVWSLIRLGACRGVF